MSKKFQGMVLGILVLTLAAGTPPAYALLGSIKKKANSAKKTATSTASHAASDVKNTAQNAANSSTAQKTKSTVTQADHQTKQMVGQLSDVFSKVTD